jgi:hypothetical protein
MASSCTTLFVDRVVVDIPSCVEDDDDDDDDDTNNSAMGLPTIWLPLFERFVCFETRSENEKAAANGGASPTVEMQTTARALPARMLRDGGEIIRMAIDG